ncbi:MAG: phosphoribosylaminoimidazolesuccinocarboxamide synthase [Deltaproteobacteria bacterium]|nr:phosphoribosylaminoimidazolesuccinocarboxamide synthase [Deltaproteobacteria bacterium]
MTDEVLQQGLGLTLDETDFPGAGALHRGKVRDSYCRGDRRTIVVTDRLSAFDVIVGTIPFKGQVLNGVAAYWFDASRELVPNHLLAVPDPAVSVVRECRVIPVEMVVRGYLTGSSSTSIWTHYERGSRTYCGHALPAGLHKHERLPRPLITPTTKAEKGAHDEPVSGDEAVARGLCTAGEFAELSALALRLFDFGTRRAAERGLLLVDTKYEFGRTPEGTLVVVDEVHTPDSSRYWYAASYEEALRSGSDPRALDKEYVRRYLVAQGFRGEGPTPVLPDAVRMEAARRYVEIFEAITGTAFVPNLEPPLERLARLFSAG